MRLFKKKPRPTLATYIDAYFKENSTVAVVAFLNPNNDPQTMEILRTELTAFHEAVSKAHKARLN